MTASVDWLECGTRHRRLVDYPISLTTFQCTSCTHPEGQQP